MIRFWSINLSKGSAALTAKKISNSVFTLTKLDNLLLCEEKLPDWFLDDFLQKLAHKVLVYGVTSQKGGSETVTNSAICRHRNSEGAVITRAARP